MSKLLSSINAKTYENMQLGAGILVKDYNPETDPLSTATLIGATSGGSTFSAVPTLRNIAENLDGNIGNVMGLMDIDSWEIKLTTTLKEFTPENVALALGSAKTTVLSGGTKITGMTSIEKASYIKSITWVGNIAGGKFVAIQVRNVLNMNGMSFKCEDKGDGSLEVEFTPFFDPANMEEVPFDVIFLDKLPTLPT